MIEVYTYSGTDFQTVFASGGWKIGLLRYSERFSALGVWERHLLTDEVFVLLSGTASLYERQKEIIRSVKMDPNKVYNVPKGVWHHIVVSKDATVLVIENSSTSKENTQKETAEIIKTEG